MERRTEELEIAEKIRVEQGLEDRKIKEAKRGKRAAERRNICICCENCEKTTRNKIRTEYEETSCHKVEYTPLLYLDHHLLIILKGCLHKCTFLFGYFTSLT